MYEIWLTLNILWELGMTILPWLIAGAVIWVLLMLPALMKGTDLLGFVSRLHLLGNGRASALREIAVPGLAMRRHFVATWRKSAYLPAAAELLIRLLADAGAAMRVAD